MNLVILCDCIAPRMRAPRRLARAGCRRHYPGMKRTPLPTTGVETGSALEEALSGFPWACVAVDCTLPRGFEDGPDLPDRVRGAMGARLREQPAGSDGALLHALMFPEDDADGGTRPFTLQCDHARDRLAIRLNLAGRVANLSVVAGFALRAALAGGIRMATENRRRVALDPSAPRFARHLGFEIRGVARPDRLHLRAVTPLALRRGRSGIAGSIDTLPVNIERRFRGLCQDWHEPVVGASGIPSRFSARLDLADSAMTPMIFDHWSNARSEPSRVACVRGEAVAYGDCRVFLPLLAFAAVFHAGSSTALGLGRIEHAAS